MMMAPSSIGGFLFLRCANWQAKNGQRNEEGGRVRVGNGLRAHSKAGRAFAKIFASAFTDRPNLEGLVCCRPRVMLHAYTIRIAMSNPPTTGRTWWTNTAERSI
jgi:hypothetical protein